MLSLTGKLFISYNRYVIMGFKTCFNPRGNFKHNSNNNHFSLLWDFKCNGKKEVMKETMKTW